MRTHDNSSGQFIRWFNQPEILAITGATVTMERSK